MFLVAEGQPVEERQILALLVLDDLQLPGDLGPVEGTDRWLPRLRQEHRERVLVAVEDEVLPDEFVDDQVFIGEFGSVDPVAVEGAEYLRPDLGSDLGQDSPFLEGLLQYFLELVNRGHYLNMGVVPVWNCTARWG